MLDVFSGDFHIINGVLRTAHSLFKKYRYEFKSNELWTEIKLVLEKLAQPLTDLLLVRQKLHTVCVFKLYNILSLGNYEFSYTARR